MTATSTTITIPDQPTNGIHRCACGCKYWEQGRCFDCGDPFRASTCALSDGDQVLHRGKVRTVVADRGGSELWLTGPDEVVFRHEALVIA